MNHCIFTGYWKLYSTGSRTALFCFKCGELINELMKVRSGKTTDTDEFILPTDCFTTDGRAALMKYLPVKFKNILFSKKKILPPPRAYCRGLVNFGKTCYINCIMQVLVNLPMVYSFFNEKREDLTFQRSLSQNTVNLSFLTVLNNLLVEVK